MIHVAPGGACPNLNDYELPDRIHMERLSRAVGMFCDRTRCSHRKDLWYVSGENVVSQEEDVWQMAVERILDSTSL